MDGTELIAKKLLFVKMIIRIAPGFLGIPFGNEDPIGICFYREHPARALSLVSRLRFVSDVVSFLFLE